MHINRKPGEQVEVDWTGDPATIIDPDTGEILKAYIQRSKDTTNCFATQVRDSYNNCIAF